MEISGITRTVASLEASRRFYEEVLGFQPGPAYEPTRWQSYACQENAWIAIGEAPGSTDELSLPADRLLSAPDAAMSAAANERPTPAMLRSSVG